MRDLFFQIEFWVAMVLAALIKLSSSPKLTFGGAVVTVVTAVLAALVFTEPLITWLELSGDIYVAAVAALVALSAEHLARQVLDMRITDIIKAWRGK